MENIMPGTRLLVFDYRLFKDDVTTPSSDTWKPATVVCRYGFKSKWHGNYPDVVDVIFDHQPEQVSKSHFTKGCQVLNESK